MDDQNPRDRIVNRVPTLREPSRLHHDIRACGGLRPFLSAMVQKYGTLAPSVFEYGYGDRDRWQIPDDPFDVSVWLEPFYPPPRSAPYLKYHPAQEAQQ